MRQRLIYLNFIMKMKTAFTKSFTCSIFLVFILSDCKKSNTQNPHPNVDVYIGGYNGDTAVYRKNGAEIQLTDGSKNAAANAITVAGTDV